MSLSVTVTGLDAAGPSTTFPSTGSPFALSAHNGAEVTEDDEEFFILTLSEQQRVKAIEFSNTAGGDGENAKITIPQGAVHDIALNDNVPMNSYEIIMTPDTTQPFIKAAILQLGTGAVQLDFSETIDVTPKVLFNPSNFNLRNSFNDQTASS